MQPLNQYLKRYDPKTGLIEGATLVERRLSQLEGCFYDETAYRKMLTEADPVVYSVSSLEPANGDGDLHIGIGQIMPGRVGAEYFLTRGHFHSWREAAEIYIGLAGEGMMLLESEDNEMQAVPLLAQSIVYVPGHTAHRTVNVGTEPLVYLGIYPAKAGHDYGAIKENNFNQVVLDVLGKAVVKKRQDVLKLR